MSPKKPYQRRLPTVPPPAPVPAPRAAPDDEQLPGPPPEPEPVPESEPELEPEPASWRVPEPRVAAAAARSGSRGVGVVFVGLAWIVGCGVFALSVVPGIVDSPTDPAGAGPSQPPRPLAPREAYVDTRVLPTGDLLVRHWIRSGVPIRSLVLALPDVPDEDDLSADQVEVVAGGTSADGPERVAGIATAYTFDAATDVLVSYRLRGAVEVSDPTEDRALAVATSLDTTYPSRAARETRVVRAPQVLSLSCARIPERTPVPCGQADGTGQWQVEMTDAQGTERVLAQVELE